MQITETTWCDVTVSDGQVYKRVFRSLDGRWRCLGCGTNGRYTCEHAKFVTQENPTLPEMPKTPFDPHDPLFAN